MAFKFSTGLRNALLKTGSLKTLLDGGWLHIYSGAVPADADAAPGTLLATMYSNGGSDPGAGGLTFDAPATGATMYKADAETWNNADLTPAGNVASGLATHFVFVGPGSGNEDGVSIGASTTQVRILGTVGGPGSDLVLSDADLTAEQVQAVNSFFIHIPESV